MRESKKWRGLLACFLSGLMCLAAAARAEAAQQRYLVPVGHTIGLKLFSDGVMVVGLGEVESHWGPATPGSDCGLQVGDVIDQLNGTEVESSAQFARLLQCGGTVELDVTREGESLSLEAQPVLGPDGTWRLGAWIRDSIAGIGTVTYYDPATGAFGALGHAIADSDTGLIMPLSSGGVMASRVKAVKRGEKGSAGELRGDFDLTGDIGLLSANTEQGVFGTLEPSSLTAGEAIPVASSRQVREGGAVIRANVTGDEVADYEVEILRVMDCDTGQNLLLRVTDEALLSLTGGIVQGMSGSPIIQDGKLVGAVTHVLVNDPTRGYGIFIENMLKAAK